MRNCARCATIFLILNSIVLTAASAATRRVPGDYPTIQAAIDATTNGDVVLVAAGTYNENIGFNCRLITVRSEAGPTQTILNGNNLNWTVHLNCGDQRATVLEGFTITGGGVYVDYARPTVRNCIFEDNVRDNGPALTVVNGSPLVEDCVFRNNTAEFGAGGAVRLLGMTGGQPEFRRCTFENNQATYEGGAVVLWDAPLVALFEDCVFRLNASGGDGGAVRMAGGNSSVFRRCRFERNSGYWGGAVRCSYAGAPRFEDCVFTENQGDDSCVLANDTALLTFERCQFLDQAGPMLRMLGGGSQAFVTYCEFRGGTAFEGAAVHLTDPVQATFERCLFAENSAQAGGGALLLRDAAVDLHQCIFAENTAYEGGAVTMCCGANLTVSESLFQDNLATWGGAVRAVETTVRLFLERCAFAANGAEGGGALGFEGLVDPVLRNCWFHGNMARRGGAAEIWYTSGLMLDGCEFVDGFGVEQGAALKAGDVHGRMANCTVAGNYITNWSGAALMVDGSSALTLTNCIVYGNYNPGGPLQINGSAPPAVTYSDVEGGYGGDGNIDADPLFADAGAGDYRLLAGSPCLESGNNGLVPAELAVDLEGHERISDGDSDGMPIVDHGAFEAVDCNGNAIPDFQDLRDGTSTDLNTNGVPDECEEQFCLNQTTGVVYPSIAAGIAAAQHGQSLISTPAAFSLTPNIDFSGKAIALYSYGPIEPPGGGTIELADGSSLAAAFDAPVTVFGTLNAPAGTRSSVRAGAFMLEWSGLLRARSGASLDVVGTDHVRLWGATRVEPDAILTLAGYWGTWNNGQLHVLPRGVLVVDGFFANDGQLTAVDATLLGNQFDTSNTLRMTNSVLIADAFYVPVSGQFIGNGELYANVNNDGVMTMTGDTLLVGNLHNQASGLIKVQLGTTTLIGQLVNHGTILGDFQPALRGAAGTQPGDGLALDGDYVAGANSALQMAHPAWRLTLGGDYDNAVNSNTRFDMVQAELRFSGGGAQHLEVMSKDIGPRPTGLDRTRAGHYPLGTLHLGPLATTVELVDVRDNDGLGQAACEALYADTVRIDAGVTLVNPACKIYYNTLVNRGTVTHPQNLVRIGPALCLGNSNCDSVVSWRDIDYFIAGLNDNQAAWQALFPPPGPTCAFGNLDVNEDGHVTWRDIDPFIARLNTTCP